MVTWCVCQSFPRLLVQGVPDDVELSREILERAGFFGEQFSYTLVKVDGSTSPADLVLRVRLNDCEHVGYDELVQQAAAAL